MPLLDYEFPEVNTRRSEQIDYILKEFDFERAVRIMNYSGYSNSNGSRVTVADAKRNAESILRCLAAQPDTISIQSWFLAEKTEDSMTLTLAPVRTDSRPYL